MRRRIILVVLALVLVGASAYSLTRDENEDRCIESTSVLYEAGSVGTQPPDREVPC